MKEKKEKIQIRGLKKPVIIGILAVLAITLAIATSEWNYNSQTNIIYPYEDAKLCIGGNGNCTGDYELMIAHNASINGSQICTQATGCGTEGLNKGNKTGYIIVGCGGATCETGYYSLAS